MEFHNRHRPRLPLALPFPLSGVSSTSLVINCQSLMATLPLTLYPPSVAIFYTMTSKYRFPTLIEPLTVKRKRTVA
jgi:hypothetical protein